jgi:hypothetical protein
MQLFIILIISSRILLSGVSGQTPLVYEVENVELRYSLDGNIRTSKNESLSFSEIENATSIVAKEIAATMEHLNSVFYETGETVEYILSLQSATQHCLFDNVLYYEAKWSVVPRRGGTTGYSQPITVIVDSSGKCVTPEIRVSFEIPTKSFDTEFGTMLERKRFLFPIANARPGDGLSSNDIENISLDEVFNALKLHSSSLESDSGFHLTSSKILSYRSTSIVSIGTVIIAKVRFFYSDGERVDAWICCPYDGKQISFEQKTIRAFESKD